MQVIRTNQQNNRVEDGGVQSTGGTVESVE